MLLELTYENSNKLLNLFNEGRIAYLDIKPVNVNETTKYVANYTMLNTLTGETKENAEKLLNNSNTYVIRMRVTELINKFIENLVTDTIIRFSLEFSVVNTVSALINSQIQFAKPSNTVTDKDIKECFDKLDSIITKMGISSVKIQNVYKREGTGKGKRNSPISVGELAELIKNNILEN